VLTDFFLKRKIAELVRRSRDVHRLDRDESIVDLGKLPPTDESLACLIEYTRLHQENSGAAVAAIRALGMMNDRRATDHLVRLLREKESRIEDAIKKALDQPHHASALPELAEIARALCRDDDLVFAKSMTDLMRSIDPHASQPYIEAMAPLVLEKALRELRADKPNYYGRPNSGESILTSCQQSSGRAALQTLQDALVRHHRQKIMSAGLLNDIITSLDWLRKSTRPAAAEAVAQFLRTPSRLVIKSYSRDVPRDEWGLVSTGHDTIWIEEPCYTSELGQPVGPEELAEQVRRAEACQAYENAETQRRHRQNIYPYLLTYGDQQDLEDYAHACLTNPRYDFYPHPGDRQDADIPKLNNLASFLRCAAKPTRASAHETTRAAELLRLILVGDRTRLWASAHEAITWRGEYGGGGIDWKPLAVELLEQTGDPAVDELLVSQIEAQWAAGQASLFTAILARRNPKQLAELSAHNLLHRSPSNGRLEARQAVLASTATARRVARELHGRTGWSDRRDAFVIMSSLADPETDAELSAWVAAEADQQILDEVAQRKNLGS
jgi:hypothetical protein